MPAEKVQFHDGRGFTSEHFSIRDKLRPVTIADKYGLALGWSECCDTPFYSIIVGKGESIIARAIACENVSVACKNLEFQLEKAYRRKKRYWKRVWAVLNFAPNWSQANIISGTGVDALFLPQEPDTAFIDFWLGKPRNQIHEGDFNGMQEHALITPRFQLLKRGP